MLYEKKEKFMAKIKETKEEKKERIKAQKERKRELKRKLKEAKVKKQFGSFFADFKKFISKGNIIDLSVAVVIGAAFNKIVNSLVNDIIMPLISLVTGGASVVDWKWIIREATYDSAGNVLTAETAFKYGVFLQAIIDFLIVAFTIFVILKVIVNSQRGFKDFSKKMKKAMKKAVKNGDEEAAAVIAETAKAPEVAPAKIESQEDILRDIRELLKKQVSETEKGTEESTTEEK
jgi:large conductance mechanosensitive channel